MMSDYITVGTILNNRYEIIEKLGHGGMAHVYKAHCHVLNRNVAIKVLRDEFVGDETFTRRFKTEAQAAAALSHANIVSIFDVASEGNLHYIVMELIEGITLKEYIEVNGALDWQTAVTFEQQICAALDCAHRNNVIHQDIKPQNMLITPEGVLKVTDFGIARATNSSTIIAGDADGAVGSVHYCSPEQARGGYTDAKTDIYSAGVVLYEMLTGRVPFDAQTPVAVAMKHLEEKVASPRLLNPDIPEDLEKVIYKSMNREKRLRYGSAAEMFRDLSYVYEGISVSNTVEEDDSMAGAQQRRNRTKKKNTAKKSGRGDVWIVLASVVCACALIGAILVFILSMGGQSNEVQVPNLINMTEAEAKAALQNSNLEFEIEKVVASTVEEGKIIQQEPRAGKTVQKGFTVKVRISAGEEFEVPDVIGMDMEDAIDELERLGLSVQTLTRRDEDAEIDEVVDQSIAEGDVAKRGDSIIIWVNTKGSEVLVPDLLGLNEEEAEELLEEEGLKLGKVVEEDSDEKKGTIISQFPEAKERLEQGEEVDIVISSGKSEEDDEKKDDEKKDDEKDPDDKKDDEEKKPDEGKDPDEEKQPEEKTWTISLTVPDDLETTRVRILVDGAVVYEKEHKKNESFSHQISGTSDVMVKVYFDETVVFEKLYRV